MISSAHPLLFPVDSSWVRKKKKNRYEVERRSSWAWMGKGIGGKWKYTWLHLIVLSFGILKNKEKKPDNDWRKQSATHLTDRHSHIYKYVHRHSTHTHTQTHTHKENNKGRLTERPKGWDKMDNVKKTVVLIEFQCVHIPPPGNQGSLWKKTQKDCKSRRLWVTIRKTVLLCLVFLYTIEQLHI